MCLFASPSGKGSTHTNSLVGVTPRGENTDTDPQEPILPSHGRTGPRTESILPQIQRKILGSKWDSICFCVDEVDGIWIP